MSAEVQLLDAWFVNTTQNQLWFMWFYEQVFLHEGREFVSMSLLEQMMSEDNKISHTECDSSTVE